MTNESWTLIVSYDLDKDVATITDPNGGTADKTIYRGESDMVTFSPGAGVNTVTQFKATSGDDNTKITIDQRVSNSSLVVTDTDNLLGTDSEVDVVYCITFTDSNNVERDTDPKLINMPTLRPQTAQAAAIQPQAARSAPAPQSPPKSPARS